MQLIRLDDLSHPALAPYARLTEAQLRNRLEPEQGIFIAESAKVIRVALAAGCQPLSMLAEEKFVGTQVASLAAAWPDLPVYTASRALLAQLTGYELSRGVLCAMRRPVLPPVADVCRGHSRLAVVDGVVNSTNTGAIFRAAAALGIEGVLLTPTCCDPLNRRSVRVSMGTVFQLPWTYFSSYAQLREEGLTLVALALTDRSVPISDPALKAVDRMGIVMGTEGDGLGPGVLALCDHTARIPMHRGVDSLNVAAAAAVAFWELVRRP